MAPEQDKRTEEPVEKEEEIMLFWDEPPRWGSKMGDTIGEWLRGGVDYDISSLSVEEL